MGEKKDKKNNNNSLDLPNEHLLNAMKRITATHLVFK